MTDAREGSPSQYFESQLRRGAFALQHCEACDQHVFYPRVLCPHCGAAELSWREASGQGTVYSTTTVRRSREKGGDYNVALIDLAEGVRLMSRVEGVGPEDVRIGMAVSLSILQSGERAVFVFRPEEITA